MHQNDEVVVKKSIFTQPHILFRAFLLCMVLQGTVLSVIAGFSPMAPRVQASPHAPNVAHIPYTVSGTVFDDYNQDGAQGTREPGVPGITVTAYNSAGTSVASTTTQDSPNLGLYSLSIPNGTGAVRVQFSNYGPSSTDFFLRGYEASPRGTATTGVVAGTSIAFVDGTAATNTVNFAVAIPTDYCENNPNMATSCYIMGMNATSTSDVMVRFPRNSSGSTAHDTIATNGGVGTTWGLAYRRSTDHLFAAAYLKRHSAFKAGGNPGDIYLINNADSASPTTNSAPFITLPAGTNPHDPSNGYLQDFTAYPQIGKLSLGGLALSDDQTTLYAMNLFNRSLYSIPIGAATSNPVAGSPTAISVPVPSSCTTNTDFRPFAVKYYRGLVLVGAVCTAESTVPANLSTLGDYSQLRGYVLVYQPGFGFFSSPIFSFPLNYTRGCANDPQYADCTASGPSNLKVGNPAKWNPWYSNFIGYQNLGQNAGQSAMDYPQPMLTDIGVENGNLIIGLRDRYGDQMGYQTPALPHNTTLIPPPDSRLVNGVTAGDTLRACLNTPGDLSSGWTLESNATCGGVTTAGAGTGEGPGGGEFYYQDNFNPNHQEVSLGGLEQVPGFSLDTTVYDPLQINSAGVRRMSNQTGATTLNYEIYANRADTFSKSNGLGDLVAFCNSAPIQVGNRVWNDTNGNGLQDAGEAAIAGVTVNLYDAAGTTLLGTQITDSTGQYFFTIQPYTSYIVRLDNATDYAIGGPLAGLQLTTAGADTTTGELGSDATLPTPGSAIGIGNYPRFAIGSHAPGENDHSFDVGFTTLPDLSITQTVTTGTSSQVGQTVSYSLSVSDVTGTVVSPNGITVTFQIPVGLSGITASGTNWTLSSGGTTSPTTLTFTYNGTFPVTPGTTLPPITVTGTLTSGGIPSLITTATVTTPGDTVAANNTSVRTITVTPAPTPTPRPDLTLTKTSNATTYVVGNTATFTVTGRNLGPGPVSSGDQITITTTLPVGLTGITASAPSGGWTFSISSTTSPASIVATYTGAYPVASGTILPAFTISGTLTNSAQPTLSCTATISTPNDSNTANNQVSGTITVNAPPTPTPIPPDLTITKSSSTTTYNAGQIATLNVNTSNVGAGAVLAGEQIVVNVTLPLGMVNVSAAAPSGGWSFNVSSTTSPTSITATYTGTYPVAAGATLPPITVTGTLTNAASPSFSCSATISTPRDSNTANNQATGTLTVNFVPTPTPTPIPPDLILTKSSGAPTYNAGQTGTITLSVQNSATAGPVPVGQSITVSTTLPLGMTGITASAPSGWSFAISSTTSPATITAIYTGATPVAAGATLPLITITGTFTNDAAPSFACSATVTTPNDSNTSNNSRSASITVNFVPTPTPTPIPPDLILTKSSNAPTYNAGQQATLSLVVQNSATAGPVNTGESITVTTTLPLGMTGITATAPSGWSIVVSSATSPTTITATYTGTYPVVAGATLPTITITGTFTNDAAPTFGCSATVTTPRDSNTTNNSRNATIPVTFVPTPTPTPIPPDLILTKSSNAPSYNAGQTGILTLSVQNSATAGPVPAGDPITVSTILPLGMTGITASAPTGWSFVITSTTSPATITATYTGATPVATGATLPTITITGTFTNDAAPTFGCSATVSTPGDSNTTNNSRSATIPVTFVPTPTPTPIPPDLILTKSSNAPSYNAGQTATLTLSVQNSPAAGPVLVGEPVTVSTTLPLGMTGITATAPSGWSISVSSTTSPTTVTATYIGTYPIAAGATLPAITITGTFTNDAAPTFGCSATVTTPRDSNTTNNSRNANIPVNFVATPTPTPLPPDLILTKSSNAPSYNVGQTGIITLSVQNSPSAGVINAGELIRVTTTLPVGMIGVTAGAASGWTFSITSTTSPTTIVATYTGAYPVVPGATLPSITISGTFTSDAAPTFGCSATVETPRDANTSNNSRSAVIPVNIVVTPTPTPIPPDLILTKTSNGTVFNAGQNGTFVLAVQNSPSAGPVPAGDLITVTTTLPVGMTGITANAPSGWNISVSSSTSPTTITATYTGPAVAPGTFLPPITISGTFTNAAAPSFGCSATVSTAADSDPSNNSRSAVLTVNFVPTPTPTVLPPDLSLTKSANGTTFNAGQTGTFTLLVQNSPSAGPVPAGDPIQVTTTLPVGMTGITATAPSGWNITLSSTTSPTTITAVYNGPAVGSGAVLPFITISGTFTNAAAPTFGCSATVETPADTNSANNSKSAVLTVNFVPSPTPTPIPPDLILTKTSNGTIFNAGQTGTFTLAVQNAPGAGPILAGEPVTVTTALPLGMTGITATTTGGWNISVSNTTSPTTITATYTGTYPIAAGAALPIITISGTFTNDAAPFFGCSATVETPRDGNTSNNAQSAILAVNFVPTPTPTPLPPDLILTKSANGTVFNAGQTGTFTIAIQNAVSAGPVVAGTPIQVTTTFPVGLTGITATAPSGWNIIVSNTTSPTTIIATYNGAYPIAPGASLPSITVSGTFTNAAAPSFGCSATVDSPADANTTNNSQSAVLTVNFVPTPTATPIPPDLILTKGSNGTTFNAGQTGIFTLNVQNSPSAGSILAGEPIQVTTTLPLGMTGIVANAPGGWNISISSTTSPTTITATYTGAYPVVPGAFLPSITISGTFTNDAAPSFGCSATVETPRDTNTANNSKSAVLTVNFVPTPTATPIPPDLTITKDDTPSPASYNTGDTVNFSVVVSNLASAGPVPVGANVTVNQTLPLGLTNITTNGNGVWSISVSSATSPASIVATYIGTLPIAPGTALAPIVVSGQLTSGAVPTFTCTASVSSPSDVNTANNSATDSIVVVQTPTPTATAIPYDLALSKTASASSVTVGSNISFTLGVQNVSAGSVPATDPIVVNQTLPVGLSNITIAPVPGWSFSVSSTTSPTTITATYTGAYPVGPGVSLPAFTISGVVTAGAGSSYTCTAVLTAPGDTGEANNTQSGTITVVGATPTVVVAPNLSIVKVDGTSTPTTSPTPGTYTAGSPVTFSLQVSNAATAGPVQNGNPITVTNTLPAGMTGISATAPTGGWSITVSSATGPSIITATYTGAYPVNPGAVLPLITISGTLTSAAVPAYTCLAVVNTPGDSDLTDNNTTDVITVNAPPPTVTPTPVPPDLAIVKSDGSPTPSYTVGDTATFTLTVSSLGGPISAGSPITVANVLPVGMTGVTATTPAGGWSISINNTTSPSLIIATYNGTYPVGTGTTLPPIIVSGTLTAAAAPTFGCSASVSTPGDSNAANNTANDVLVVTVPPTPTPSPVAPDLVIFKSDAAPGAYTVGNAATFTLNVANFGGPVVSGNPIIVNNTLPVGMTNVTATAPSGGWSITVSSTTSPTLITATYTGAYPVVFGTVLPPITISGTLTANAVPTFGCSASVTTPGDSNTQNNTATDVLAVSAVPTPTPTQTPPDLTIIKSAGSPVPAYSVGDTVTFGLTVTNLSGTVTNGSPIIVTNILPVGMTGVTATAPSGWDIQLNNSTSPTLITATYTGTYPVLAGATLPTITVTGVLSADAVPNFVCSAGVTTPGDTNTANNSSTDVLVVNAPPTPTPSPVAPDLILIKSDGSPVPSNYEVGEIASFTLTASNIGGPVVDGNPIVVNNTLPAGMTNITAIAPTGGWSITVSSTTSPSQITATYTGAYPVAQGATLPSIVISGTLTVEAAPSFGCSASVTTPGDSNAANNNATDVLFVSVVPTPTPTQTPPDLTIIKSDGTPAPANYNVGDSVTLNLTVANLSGAVTAGSPIIVTNVLPAGITNVTATAPAGSWNIQVTNSTSPSLITATYIGTYPVPAGAVLPTITISGLLTVDAVPAFACTATVTTPGDSNVANNNSTDVLVVSTIPTPTPTQTPPDLTIVKTEGAPAPSAYNVGDTITYNLSVNNLGGAVPAGNQIIVSQSFPIGATNLVATAPAGGWSFTLTNTTSPTLITATYTGTYPVAAGAVLPPIVVTGTLTANAVPTFGCAATVTTPLDSNPANNTATDTITVNAPPTPTMVPVAPDLLIFKSDGSPVPSTYTSGSTVNFSLIVANLGGPVMAGDQIIVTNTLPVGLVNVSATSASGAWSIAVSSTTSPSSITATYIGAYPVGQGTTLPPITISGTLTDAAAPFFGCTASVTTPGDSNPQNNNATDVIVVNTVPTPTPSPVPPDLTIIKSNGSPVPSYNAGDAVSFTLTVANLGGPVTAGNQIIVTNSLPVGMTGVSASAPSGGWTFSINNSTSPSLITATYTGAYPVAAGATLAPITVSGTLTNDAAPTFGCSATVTTPEDTNPANNTATDVLAVNFIPTPTPTTTPFDLTLNITDSQPTPGTGTVGDTIVFTIQPGNVGLGPVVAGTPVHISGTLPAGLTGITITAPTGWTIVLDNTTSPTQFTATYVGTYPILPGQNLPAITITGQLTNDALPNFVVGASINAPGDNNATNDSVTDSLVVNPLATPTPVPPDLAIVKSASTPVPGTYTVGDTVSFGLQVINVGAGAVTSDEPIVVTNTLPVGITNVTAVAAADWSIVVDNTTSPTQITATYNGPYPVAPGQVLNVINISGTLTAAAVPSFGCTATVTTPGDTNPVNNSATDVLTVNTIPTPTPSPAAPFDLTLTISDGIPGTGSYNVGDTVNFNVQVINVGAGTVNEGPVIVTSTLPLGFTNVSVVAPTGWNIVLDNTTSPTQITATYTGAYPVAPGQVLPVITITGTLTVNAVPTLGVSGTVTAPGDAVATNNTATDVLAVVEIPTPTATALPPDLLLVKGASAGSATVGDTVNFTLNVQNAATAGPITAGPITVTNVLPIGLTNISATGGADWTITLSSTTSPTTVTATYNGTFPIAPGTSLPVITVTGTLTNDADANFDCVASVSAPGDVNVSNNSLDGLIVVNRATPTPVMDPDLLIVKNNVGGEVFNVGDTVNFSVLVQNALNAGPVVTGDPITVTINLPDGVNNVTVAPNSAWSFMVSSTTSPTTINAMYIGAYPVVAGQLLPAINFSGQLNGSGGATLDCIATVLTPADRNLLNNTSADQLLVNQSLTPVPTLAPDVKVNQEVSGTNFTVGDAVTFTVTAATSFETGPVVAPNTIVVTQTLPVGITNITTNGGGNWNIVVSSTTGPSLITATYTGTYPVLPGTTLPAFTVTGTLTEAASPTLTSAVEVSTPGDIDSTNNTDVDSVTVQLPPTAIPSPTPRPDVSITLGHVGGNVFNVGNTVTFNAIVTDVVGSVVANEPIVVSGSIPVGLDNVVVSGNGWIVTDVIGTSPTLFTATYTPTTNLAPGAVLPSLVISGTLNQAAVPNLTIATNVSTFEDLVAENNQAVDSVLVLGVPVTPSVLPIPDVTIDISHQGGANFTVGQTATFVVNVSNLAGAQAVTVDKSVVVTLTIPAGLTNVGVVGQGWSIGTVYPNSLTVYYSGTYPVLPGQQLPPFYLTGVLTDAATPSLTVTAAVATPGESNTANNTDTDEILVTAVGVTPTFTPVVTVTPVTPTPVTPTPTVTVVPSVTPTQTPLDLTVDLFHAGGNTFQVGKPVTFTAQVSGVSGILPVGVPVRVEITLPVGLKDIFPVANPAWTITLSNTTGPAQLIATLTNPSALRPGETLPPIFFTGVVTQDAGQSYTAQASVSTPNDTVAGNNADVDTILVMMPVTRDVSVDIVQPQANTVYQVGQQVTYVVNSRNNGSAITTNDALTMTIDLPRGLSNLVATDGSDWKLELSNQNGPAQVNATYVGTRPIPAGAQLPPITITGRVTPQAGPELTTTATIAIAGDTVAANNRDQVTILVKRQAKPDVAVSIHADREHYEVGDHVIFDVKSANLSGKVFKPNSIVVKVILPVGLKDITVRNADPFWQVYLSNTTGPAVLEAIYLGEYPVHAGEILPTFQVEGKLTHDAVPSLTVTAIIGAPEDSNPLNNVSVTSILVKKNQNNHHNDNDNGDDNDNDDDNNGDDNNDNDNNGNHNNDDDDNGVFPGLPRTGSRPFLR